jgi:homoserine kinase
MTERLRMENERLRMECEELKAAYRKEVADDNAARDSLAKDYEAVAAQLKSAHDALRVIATMTKERFLASNYNMSDETHQVWRAMATRMQEIARQALDE